MTFVPYAVSWNLTARCNLNCQHCYIDAGGRAKGDGAELSTDKVCETIDRIAHLNPGAVLILTGGEPMAREDIYEISSHASKLGLMVVLGTNGTMLNADTARRLADAGVMGVGVSIDSLRPEEHDSFRGYDGALKKSIAGLLAARDAGINIQVQTTPTSRNLEEIPLIAEWAHRIGAKVFNLFFLVCTGRGEEMADITPDEYEKILKWAATARESFPGMMIRPKCAPHFKRILYQENPDSHLLKTYIAACRAGTHYCRITPEGNVTPCPYMDNVAGSIVESDFVSIWNESEGLSRYREPEYDGKCGRCKYRLLCGGCRARALATDGNDMGEDAWCVYEPIGQEEAIVNIDTQSKFGAEDESGLEWTKEALDTLEKIPVFARSIVKLGVEKVAREKGIEVVTLEVMRDAAPSPQFMKPPAAPDKKKGDGGKEIPWDDDAKERIANAPEFVRPGIMKLMPIRARERGVEKITTQFLTEIRDESMMLVTRRMKKFGFDNANMGAWDVAKGKMKKSPAKQKVIDQITAMLGSRAGKNEKIMEKFESFFADDVGEKMGWTDGARQRLERAPEMLRPMVKKTVEKYAKENGFKFVTEEAVQGSMDNSPMKMPFK